MTSASPPRVRLDPTQRALLKTLADRQFHSSTELAAALGLSRTGIWKAIHALGDAGVAVAAIPGKGYRLGAPVELLDETAIRASMSREGLALLQRLDLLDSIDSTNAYLLRAAAAGSVSGHVCLAEAQTAGRGRLGRQWLSPLGANLYLSILWQFDDVSALGGLSLAVGAALAALLESTTGLVVALKWPNDLLWQDRKLGGILLEINGETHGRYNLVIGIGLNRFLPAESSTAIGQPVTDLHQALGESAPRRNALAGSVIDAVLQVCRDFPATGLSAYLETWRRYHGLAGRQVAFQHGHEEWTGRIVDIDDHGRILIGRSDGSVGAFASGEVQLRRVDGMSG